MRLLELFINGQPIDLPANTRGLIKYSQARSALADIAARVGEFSYPLTLPATSRNAQAFGVDKLHPLALAKFGPFTDYAYELRVVGRLFAGTFRLSSLKGGYTGNLIGEGLSWALELGDKKLTDLQFPALSYDGSQLESILAQDCDTTDVQFPLVAFGNFFTPPTIRTDADGSTTEVPVGPGALLDYPLSVDDYPPGVYYVNVLRQIFASIGWHLTGRELDSPAWRDVVLTPAGADLSAAWPWGALLPASAKGRGSEQHAYVDHDGDSSDTAIGRVDDAPAGLLDGLDMAGSVFFLPVPVPLINSGGTRALAGPQSAYTAPVGGTYGFSWSASITRAAQNLLVNNGQYARAAVRQCLSRVALAVVVRRGGRYDDFGLMAGTPDMTNVASYQYINAGESIKRGSFAGTGSVYLEAGDVAQLCVVARSRLTDTPTNTDAITREFFELTFGACSFACTSYQDDAGVSKQVLNPADFLPPLPQRDVVRDFLQRTDALLVADTGQRVATLLSRAELSQAGGEPLDLSGRCDVRAVEYLPAAGAGVGSIVFAPAENADDPLTPAGADVVLASVGQGSQRQDVGSLFAPVAFRTTYVGRGITTLPTCSTAELLKQNRSEAAWEVESQPPRLLRYLGPDASLRVPFQQRTVPLARAAWDGALCWDGEAGAVATYYADTLRRAVEGHIGRVSLPLSPALYQQLQPGRRVYLHGGATYTVESLSGFDPSDEAALASLDLSREVL